MFNVERASLSQKLTLIAVLSTGSALLLLFAVFVATTVLGHRDSERRQLSSLAAVIGASATDALRAGDHHRAAASGAGQNARNHTTSGCWSARTQRRAAAGPKNS